MNITYKESRKFSKKDLEELFLSVNWESAQYPERLVTAMQNSSQVISAWNNDRLIGLVRSLDDGITVAFIHYLLVNPEYQNLHIGSELMKRLLNKYKHMLYIKIMPSDPQTIAFYKKFGFMQYNNYSALEIKNF